jgi:hypothetical protein
MQRPYASAHARFELLPFRSPLLGEFSLFLEVLRCFSSLRAPRCAYVFSARFPSIPSGGFPHSDISGSSLVGSSPKLFAACYVLHRPLTPRHPPCALCSLIYVFCVIRVLCSVFKVRALRRCGDEGTRTPGLLRAREALSHLSYVPPHTTRTGPGSRPPVRLWAFLDLNQRPCPYQRHALAV